MTLLATRRLISLADIRIIHRGTPSKRSGYHDYIRGPTPGGVYKIPFPSPKLVGVRTSRGTSLAQQDATAICGLQLPVKELKYDLERLKTPWDPIEAGSEFLAGQTAYFGIFDGHGGDKISSYLSKNLHGLIETVRPETTNSVVQWTKSNNGGYFKRWRGGVLSKWMRHVGEQEVGARGNVMTLEERLTLAFLTADREVLQTYEEAKKSGSTASVVLLHSLDSPAVPYWAAKKVHLTVGHCGDTRALLCRSSDGQVVPLTERHHAEARVEAARLRRMGADNLVADSFGESKWMGAIENTRGFGDGEWKASGVTAEPEVVSRVINGEDYSYLILVTDGLTDLMSDQEIIDLARNASDPTRAATTILHFGEDLNAEDNCTVIVVPLAAWGKVGGKDTTEARREYRRNQAGMLSTRMQRM